MPLLDLLAEAEVAWLDRKRLHPIGNSCAQSTLGQTLQEASRSGSSVLFRARKKIGRSSARGSGGQQVTTAGCLLQSLPRLRVGIAGQAFAQLLPLAPL